MSVTFHANAAVICCNCPKVWFVRLTESCINPGNEDTIINVIFTVCAPCTRYPHINDLGEGVLWRRHIDVQQQPYADMFHTVGKIFWRTPVVFDETRFFSVMRLGMKTLARIRDLQTISLMCEPGAATLDDEASFMFINQESARPIRKAISVIALAANDENSEDKSDRPELEYIPLWKGCLSKRRLSLRRSIQKPFLGLFYVDMEKQGADRNLTRVRLPDVNKPLPPLPRTDLTRAGYAHDATRASSVLVIDTEDVEGPPPPYDTVAELE